MKVAGAGWPCASHGGLSVLTLSLALNRARFEGWCLRLGRTCNSISRHLSVHIAHCYAMCIGGAVDGENLLCPQYFFRDSLGLFISVSRRHIGLPGTGPQRAGKLRITCSAGEALLCSIRHRPSRNTPSVANFRFSA